MEDVFLTVIIPTYKRSDNLERAINSIINQEGDFELIVVDDNDSDTEYRKINEKLMEQYEKYPNIKYIKHDKNKNGAAARNTGIKHAAGKYITFLDDDDEFSNERIKSIENFLKDTNIEFACTGFVLKKNGVIQQKVMPNVNFSNRELQLKILCQESFFGTGSNIICRKDIVEKIGGFDEKFVRHQDMEFVNRIFDEIQQKIVIDNYSVIKNCDDNSNVPNIEKLFNVKKMYLKKFENQIKTYNKKEQQKIIYSNYNELLNIAFANQNKDDIKKVIKILKQNKIYRINRVIYLNVKLILKKIKKQIIKDK